MPLRLPPISDLSLQSDEELWTSLAPITSTRGRKSVFTNWATTFRSQTTATFRPTTVDQVRTCVELARRQGKELRAAGSGHSPSDLVCTDGYVLNMHGLNRMLEIDTSSRTFHAEAGMVLKDIHPLLHEANLAIPSLGSISDQTLAGAISTATHGSGVTFGNLSTMVTFLDLVLPLPGAPLVRVNRQQDPELFLAALCGLGVVGVIVGVGMEVENRFNLEEECFSLTLKDFVSRWREIAESDEHVRCWWFPQVGEVKVSRMHRTKKTPTQPIPIIQQFVTDTVIAKWYHAFVLMIARKFPNLLPFHAHVMYALVHRPGPFAMYFLFSPQHPERASSSQPNANRQLENGHMNGMTRSKASHSLENGDTALEVEAETTEVGSEHVSHDVSSAPVTDDGSDDSTIAPDGPVDEEGHEIITSRPGSETGHHHSASKHNLPPLPLLTTPTMRIDDSVSIFNYDCGFPQYTYEGAIPYEETGNCILALESWLNRELKDPKGLRGHFPIELRFTEKDDIWLSPSYGQRTCYIGVIHYRPFNLPVSYKTLFKTFESLLLSHGGRPHWAKSHNCSRLQLREMYPKFDDFLKVRERVDPEGVLLNAYAKRHLMGSIGEDVDMRRYKPTRR